MNTFELEGDWNISEGMQRGKWNTLTPDDLQHVKGSHDEWLGRIQKRTGQTREAIDKAIKDVFSSRSRHAVNALQGLQVSQCPLPA